MAGRAKKILIVDDEQAFARLLKAGLEMNGNYEVRLEDRGTNAVAAASAFRPDLILLDVMMPDIDGGRIAADVRLDPALREIPIVFLTAVVARNKVVDLAGAHGPQTFLAKPVTIEDVIRTIEGLTRAA